jgi:hypothetical protein
VISLYVLSIDSSDDPIGNINFIQEVNKYDTDLDYIGTVSYTDEYNCHHWTYFNQIIAVIPQDDFETRIFKELDKLNNLGTKYQY